MMSDQNASEQMPNTLILSTMSAWASSVKASSRAYSGLVPMSP